MAGLAYGGVQFYYRPKGSSTWRKDNSAQTDAYGHFRNSVGVHLGTANWKVQVGPSSDTLASTSTNTVTSIISDRTHFASVLLQGRLASPGCIPVMHQPHPVTPTSVAEPALRRDGIAPAALDGNDGDHGMRCRRCHFRRSAFSPSRAVKFGYVTGQSAELRCPCSSMWSAGYLSQ